MPIGVLTIVTFLPAVGAVALLFVPRRQELERPVGAATSDAQLTVYDVARGTYSLDDLIRWGGYLVLVAIVFTETGLLIGFFLPGDSLLITAGLVAA